MTGWCEVGIPEWLYDRDCPGHYMRRIKSVAVSIPSVVGPYTSINCTLALLRSSIRVSTNLEPEYKRSQSGDDTRFVDLLGSVESVVTSTATNDAGTFGDTRDDRFGPFEGSGAQGLWRLELPGNERLPGGRRPFDFMTISDAILHIRYTARPGGDRLAQAAIDATGETVGNLDDGISSLLFSLRHDFPTEWSAFVNNTADDLVIGITRDMFPYFAQGQEVELTKVTTQVYGGKNGAVTSTPPDSLTKENADSLNGDERAFELSLAPNETLRREAGADVFLVVRYGVDSSV